MERYESLTQILTRARERDREIRFIDGEKDETAVSFRQMWDDALALLGSLQSHGMKAGDELVIFTRVNRKFVTAFWAGSTSSCS